MKQVASSLRDLLASVVGAMNYEFVGCELHRHGQSSTLRIFIDGPEGINADACGKVSRQISAMLDVEDPIKGRYTLEVSSPGIERPLFELDHYVKYVGHKIKIRVLVPIENRRNIVGVLTKVEGTNIHLLVDGKEIEVPFPEIEKAKLIVDINVG